MNPKTDSSKRAPLVRLGELIEECTLRNSEANYEAADIVGIDINKTFIKTVANLQSTDLSKYKVVPTGYFACNLMHVGRDVRIPIAYNSKLNHEIVSPAYFVFSIKENSKSRVLPEFLSLIFLRYEFDRFCWFSTDSSIRGNLQIGRFLEIQIPLPSIEVQRELVAIYEGCRKIVDENLALITHLERVCHAFVVDCKSKYPPAKLGDLIEERDERNYDLCVKLSQGISNLKFFQAPKQVAENSRSDKIVRKGQFAYNRATTRNGEKISIAYREGEDCTVSSAYGVFRIVSENVLDPRYLMLFFNRSEFDRFARWRSEGSAHEFFTFEMMQNVQIPLPPREVQESIVSVYHCIEEAKRIVRETRERMEALCPALVQKAAHAA